MYWRFEKKIVNQSFTLGAVCLISIALFALRNPPASAAFKIAEEWWDTKATISLVCIPVLEFVRQIRDVTVKLVVLNLHSFSFSYMAGFLESLAILERKQFPPWLL